jgi:hypothetical protein
MKKTLERAVLVFETAPKLKESLEIANNVINVNQKQ